MGTAGDISVIWAGTRSESAASCEDPVFVLCAGRSGSTLLRFILDSHPVLACPAETKIPWLCGLMASAWSVAEDVSLDSANPNPNNPNPDPNNANPDPGNAPGSAPNPEADNSKKLRLAPGPVLAGLRKSFDPLIAACLERTGKRRFCDKSLGGAMYAGLLRQVWPKAKFISLYRHPMDLIGSGIEASPWGLDGYGFENYTARFPGNNVAALAEYWLDYTRAIVAAERRFGPDCLRMRYEDLVAEPEAEAKRVFDFLGVDAVPGITETMFAGQHQQAGPGDHKIWQTTRVSADSVGRGWDIPPRLIPPPLLAAVNTLAGGLGYLPVTRNWGTGDKPYDVRVPA
ncbi:MAG TPA: sulfotransferase [Trebonia sp.]|nr:sulfotransferase [Trebonia sp.]